MAGLRVLPTIMPDDALHSRPDNGANLMRFDTRKPNRVGDLLRQAFGDAKKDDRVASEFDRLLRQIS